MSTEPIVIDLRSDTVTKPTETMKQALLAAPVGDDVYAEDPTVNALQDKVADMLGQEAALFVPSGTMANLIAMMVHCHKRGAEMLCGDQSHVYKREAGSAHITGIQITGVKNLADGTMDLKDLEDHIRGGDIHEPITMMVSVENTHSYCGGKVLPLSYLESLAALSKKHGLILHMDGARLFNAAEYLHVDPVKIAGHCDSVSVCFSKGLGAPVGSALAGTRRFIDQARRIRKMLGGGMRQAGVLAACAVVALDESIPQLDADHRRAKFLATAIKNLNLKTFSVDLENQQTNIVHIKINPNSTLVSSKVVQRLALVTESESQLATNNQGILVKASNKPSDKNIRFVTHFGIKDDDIRLAVKKIEFVFREMDKLYA